MFLHVLSNSENSRESGHCGTLGTSRSLVDSIRQVGPSGLGSVETLNKIPLLDSRSTDFLADTWWLGWKESLDWLRLVSFDSTSRWSPLLFQLLRKIYKEQGDWFGRRSNTKSRGQRLNSVIGTVMQPKMVNRLLAVCRFHVEFFNIK